MKKALFFILVCALGFTAFGQTISLRSADKAECVKSDMNGLTAMFSFSSLDATTVETSRGEFSEIHIDGSYPNGNVGEPQLPMFTKLIVIPTGATPIVTVGAHSETDYTLSNYRIGTVSAMQAPIRKDVEPSTVEYAFNEAAYNRNSFNDDPVAMVEMLGTMRGLTIGRLIVQPVRYNPVAGTVKVFNDIEVNVSFENGDAESTEKMFKSTCSPAFQSVYDQLFNIDMLMGSNSKDAFTDHPDLYNTPVKMLVICYSGFQGNAALNNWLQWKLQKGYYVDIYYTSEAGTSASAIASFIKTKYNASVSSGNAYTYLIVIGDTGQVPQYMNKNIDSSIGNCASDLGYSSVNFSSSTSNYFPDMYYSRISVENTTQLANYMNKVLTYERFEFTDGGNYLNNVILVGGWDSNWTSRVAKPTINYGTNYYFNSSNTTYGGFSGGTIKATISTSSTAGYSGTNNGCYQGINNGVCFLNYTAHGDKQEWYQPKMTAAHVATLTNTGKYFFGVGNCCLTGNFNNTTTTYSPGSSIGTNACFAETMIRVPNAGAIAYVGCSPYSYWYEDFYWAVGAHSFSQGNYPSTTASSKGVYDVMFMDQYWNSASALNYVGNLAVQQAVTNNNSNSSVTDGNCNNSAHYYFQFYHTFGDGSVMPYITKPEANSVTIPSTVSAGATSITVNAVAGSYVAVTNNSSVIYGVGVANSSGVATVHFTNTIPSSGTLYVVVTRQQYQPYFGTVTISGGNSPTYYTITASANPSAGGTVAGTGSFASGATCTLKATPATGYQFTNWTKNGTQVSTNANYSFTVSANATYVANFTQVETPTPDPGTVTEVTIGSGSSTNAYLPTYAYYKYSLTEQIYTAAEVGQAGTITSVSFKVSNSKSTTRTIDLYMKHTSNSSFSSTTGWETLSSSNKVFSGSITFNASGWTTITLSTPFVYNGTSNLLIGMDDNTGSYVSSSNNSPQFYVYSTGANRALRVYSDNTNYSPASPSSYTGTFITSNNQVLLGMEGAGTPAVTNYTITASANPAAGGTVRGAGTYSEGSSCTLKATPADGYQFVNWTKNGTQVSTNLSYTFNVTASASYVANFSVIPTSGSDVTIGSGTATDKYLPTYTYYNYSLTEQIYTAAEIGQAGTISSISFKVSNSKSTTRTIDLYMKHTSKSAFTSTTGWETLSLSNKVFSGSVTFNASGWTTITLSTPFVYNGSSNLLIGMDDNTGSYISSSNSPQFYVYSTGANRAMRVYNDNTNYDPASPSSYTGTYVTSNNQIMLGMDGSAVVVNNYTITATANPTAGGTVTGAGTYEEGSTVTLTATPATGYTFSKWTKNGSQVSTSATYSFTATANAAYVAVFTLNSYAISASASPAAGGTISGAGTYNYGSTCTLTATANNGYEFSKWTKNGSQVSTNPSYSFTVTGSASYVANFTQVVTPTPDPGTTDVTIGSGTATDKYLPTYTYYNYSLTEQIYTAAEIGQAGTISSISFKVSNSKSTTRTIDLYMKHTSKSAFTSTTGWETLSLSNKVFSGSVTFNASGWTTITLDTPFAYNGTSNLLVGVDDNTGSYISSSNSPQFYVYSTGTNRAMRVYNDNTNYNPASPSSYTGTYVTSNNQIMLGMSGSAVVGGGGDVTIGSGTSTNAYLPTYAYYKYSLTEQIYTASEIGHSGTITTISFKVSNSKSATRTLAIYMKHTTKTAFTSNKGWEAVSSSNLVYSGSVTFNASGWTTITLNTPFEYNGTSNLLLAVDDNTGSYVSSSSNSPSFYVYSTGANRALRIYSDGTNYSPSSPSSYSGTYVTSNNQIMLGMTGRKIIGDEPAEVFGVEDKVLVIYPNPIERNATFTIELPDDMVAARVEVFNTHGACIYKGQANGNIEMSCDKMTSGIYVVRIIDGENVMYGKVIVK